MSDAWKLAGEGPIYVPILNACEVKYAIPTDLLARIAFQESSFRPGVISGAIKSKPGAVGIMQLLPKYFPSAGVDPRADINTAGEFLKSLWTRFDDWQVAVAAYNWGGGSVHHEYVLDHSRYVLADMPPETRNYVTEVFADVPLPGKLLC
jgi:soluble lytic murein transglycosylase-like protein